MSNAPKWLTPVAIVALLWNLLGCVGWVADMRATPEKVAAMGPDMIKLYAALPAWLPAATGVAVLGGVAGCLGLWLRKHWAEWFTVVATGSLIPLEAYEVIEHASWLKLGILVGNVVIVVYLARIAMQPHRRR